MKIEVSQEKGGAVMATQPLVQYLSVVGDGTGNIEQAAAWTPAAPGFFFMAPLPGTIISIYTMQVGIMDNVANYGPQNYGGIAVPGLANGIKFETFINGTLRDSLDTQRIKQNGDWSLLGEVSFPPWTNGTQMVFLLDFARRMGAPLTLRSPADYFGMRLTDNLSTLLSQRAFVLGVVDYQPPGVQPQGI